MTPHSRYLSGYLQIHSLIPHESHQSVEEANRMTRLSLLRSLRWSAMQRGELLDEAIGGSLDLELLGRKPCRGRAETSDGQDDQDSPPKVCSSGLVQTQVTSSWDIKKVTLKVLVGHQVIWPKTGSFLCGVMFLHVIGSNKFSDMTQKSARKCQTVT